MKNRIVLAREQAGLTQKELAQRMGVSPSTLNGYEKGNHDPKSAGLAAIARLCGVTVDYLLELTDDPRGQFAFHTSDTDPQLEALTQTARRLNAQGLQKLVDLAEDLVASGRYEKQPLDRERVAEYRKNGKEGCDHDRL
ncbi:MAG: helix-turn-helix domain-containing protein [Clostridiales bacterium]|nr:helix-turn-helix domain-containing protein [Clostridiales bacterium]